MKKERIKEICFFSHIRISGPHLKILALGKIENHLFFLSLIRIFASTMLPMLQIIPIMWHAVRPSKVADMPAVVNRFWLRKGYEGLTFFGTILTRSQEEADRFNNSHDPMKNHEMIHLRQAQATGDSWLRFYLLYIWYWFRIFCFGGFAIRRQLRNAAYLLNPFEMEAYGRMNDAHYLDKYQSGATEWRLFARMSVKERLQYYLRIRQQLNCDT